MSERWDVAIIGTGAGGGTLAWALAGTGKRILLLERGCSCRASARTGARARCTARAATPRARSGATRPAGRSTRTRATASAATPSSTAPRCSACAARTSARSSTGALAHPNVTLPTGARVTRLGTSPSGREVTAIHVERAGRAETHVADLVVVAAGAINSAALLLRSASDRHPAGLANGSGVVGRHYMGHVRTLDLMARHSLDFWLTSEDLPDPDNRATLDREGRIVLSYRPNNEEGHRRLVARVKDLMARQTRCGVHGHECHEGVFARSHEVDNLYVVDGSVFPSSAAVNPALTIMANALRVGDHLRERLGA